jgi:CDP-diglyceride synthetase
VENKDNMYICSFTDFKSLNLQRKNKMLDKITLMFVLPFYGLWKILLSKNSPVKKKPFQMFLLNINALSLFLFLSTIYHEVSIFWLKILLGALILVTITVLISNTVKASVYSVGKDAWESNKLVQYSSKIISLIIIIFIMIYTDHKLTMFFLIVGNLSDLMFLVGFEFPDEPPKKKEEKKVEDEESWLEKLIPPTPVGSS